MANIVEIILKANDQTGGAFNKLNSSFKSLTGFSLSAAGGIAMAGMAISKAVEYTKQAIAANDKYVSSIVDMARFTGDQTDAMSRLVQVADDAFLSQEALNNAMSIGAKKGLDMSVQGIKDLADQYNSLATVQEKNKLLNDNFGRSGLAMGKLLEQGSAGITKNMEAIADNLVVTDKSVKITYDYKKSVDALNDSMDGLKYTVAQQTMPAMTDLNTILTYYIEKSTNAEEKTGGWGKELLRLVPFVYSFVNAFKEITIGLDEWANSLDKTKISVSEASDLYQSHRGYVEGVTEATEDATIATRKLSDAFRPLTNEMIYNSLAASLDSQGQLDLARHLGLVDEQAYNALNQLQTLKDKYDINKDGVIRLTERTWEYYAALKAVTDTAGTYNWNFVVTSNSPLAPSQIPIPDGGGTTLTKSQSAEAARYAAMAKQGVKGANGLDFIVPGGYPNDSYPVNVQSGEHVKVTPANKIESGLTKSDLRAAFTEAMSPIMSMMMSEFAKLT